MKNITFGRNIAALRKQYGLSQEKLGDRMNVTRETVSNWETEQNTPTLDTIVALCDFFNVPLEKLVFGECNETAASAMLNEMNNTLNLIKNMMEAKASAQEEAGSLYAAYQENFSPDTPWTVETHGTPEYLSFNDYRMICSQIGSDEMLAMNFPAAIKSFEEALTYGDIGSEQALLSIISDETDMSEQDDEYWEWKLKTARKIIDYEKIVIDIITNHYETLLF